MGRARDSSEPEDPEKTPEGLPPASSSARFRLDREDETESDAPASERCDPTTPIPLRPPTQKSRKKKRKSKSETSAAAEPIGEEAPAGLPEVSTSARQRLELALDVTSSEFGLDEADDHADEPVYDPALDRVTPEAASDRISDRPSDRPPTGLRAMTYSARLRLELALDQDSVPPPQMPARTLTHEVGAIPFDHAAEKLVRSLGRWIAFCGLITMSLGALTGLSYLTGPGSVAHVVVGILASALSVWLLLAAYHLHRGLRDRNRQKRLVEALGLLRSALLLKAILLFSGMVLGCFAFSIVASLSLLLL